MCTFYMKKKILQYNFISSAVSNFHASRLMRQAFRMGGAKHLNINRSQSFKPKPHIYHTGIKDPIFAE